MHLSYLAFIFVLFVSTESNAFDQGTILLKKNKSLQWAGLSNIDAMAHASFCNASIKLKNASDKESALIASTFNEEKFCTVGDYDGDGRRDIVLVYTHGRNESPPCKSLLVLRYETRNPEIYQFVIEKAQSCNVRTFDQKKFKRLFGSSASCDPPRSNVDSMVIYGEGDVTTLFTFNIRKSSIATQECYGGAD